MLIKVNEEKVLKMARLKKLDEKPGCIPIKEIYS